MSIYFCNADILEKLLQKIQKGEKYLVWPDKKIDMQRRNLEERTLLKRLGTTQDMGAAAAFLASDDASYISGETIVVAGGTQSRL
jgi:NAD(P)-dependent dehydrogenase (short-subunit alcohol dehydrogenase family)